jgi:hypothetical protein
MRFDDFKKTGYSGSILVILLVAFSFCSYAEIINVPDDLPNLSAGIDSANPGDTILIAPGTYSENNNLRKDLTIASWFLTTGDTSYIRSTVIDGGSNTVFNIFPPVTEATFIIGLTIQNGDDGIMAEAPFNLLHNYITTCEDGIDYESGSGGTCNNNTFRFNSDDGIDLDGTLYFISIEDNIIIDNDDDGIEIRLHSYVGGASWCQIRNNTICRNGEDGIQFIDYPDISNRTYLLERNLICDNDMAGIACMDNGVTQEDYRGAAIPEPIYVFNNTISGNDHGMTGGASLIAVNNLIINSATLGAKNVAGNSLISHCLLYNNGQDFINCNLEEETNIFSDPLIDDNYTPVEGSPCIDKGIALLVIGSDTVLNLLPGSYFGTAPDIGAMENNPASSLDLIETEQEFIVYPNPFHDILEIISEDSNNHNQSQVIDTKGTVLLTVEMTGRSTRLNLAPYPPGIYYLRYFGKKEINIRQIVKI